MKRWLLVVLVPLAFRSQVSAQITVGLSISKTCPNGSVPPSSTFICTFSITNLDTANGVTGLAVTNTVPCPNPPTCTGGTTTAVPCNQSGSPVTALGPNGTATDTCTGSVQETAPACGASTILFRDQIAATANDGANLATGSTTNSVSVLACTPTPTNTPTTIATNTPTRTPTNTPTPTSTPVPSNIPVVPTLSFPLLGLLALALAAAALFVMRRL